jgi:hypothetical protein
MKQPLHRLLTVGEIVASARLFAVSQSNRAVRLLPLTDLAAFTTLWSARRRGNADDAQS